MDIFTEYNPLSDYYRWTNSSARFARAAAKQNSAEGKQEMEVANFWEEINEEFLIDYEEVIKQRVRKYR